PAEPFADGHDGGGVAELLSVETHPAVHAGRAGNAVEQAVVAQIARRAGLLLVLAQQPVRDLLLHLLEHAVREAAGHVWLALEDGLPGAVDQRKQCVAQHGICGSPCPGEDLVAYAGDDIFGLTHRATDKVLGPLQWPAVRLGGERYPLSLAVGVVDWLATVDRVNGFLAAELIHAVASDDSLAGSERR